MLVPPVGVTVTLTTWLLVNLITCPVRPSATVLFPKLRVICFGFTAACGLKAPTDPPGGRVPRAVASNGCGLKTSRIRPARARGLQRVFRLALPNVQKEGVALGTISAPPGSALEWC